MVLGTPHNSGLPTLAGLEVQNLLSATICAYKLQADLFKKKKK